MNNLTKTIVMGMLLLTVPIGAIAAPPYWAKTYSAWAPYDTWDDIGWCVKEVPADMNGGFIVTGHTTPHGTQDFNILVVRLNNAGNVLWAKNYDSDEVERSYSIDVIPESAPQGPGYIVVGHIAPNFSGPYDVLVMRLNAIGVPLWTNRYNFGWNYETATCVRTTPSGDYIVVGGVSSTYRHLDSLMVMKLDDYGNPIPGGVLPRIYNIKEGDFGYWSVDAFMTGDVEEYILAGWTQNGIYGQDDAIAIKLHSNLTPVWIMDYGIPSDNDRFYCIRRTSSNSFIVAGETNSPSSGSNWDMLAVELDNTGWTNWAKTYGNVWDMDDWARSIDEISPTDGYIFTGGTYYDSTATDMDLVVTQVNPIGNLLWSKVLRPIPPFPQLDEDDLGLSIEVIQDGEYIVAGLTRSLPPDPTYADFLVCKLNPSGDILPDTCLLLYEPCEEWPEVSYDSVEVSNEIWQPEDYLVDMAYDTLYVDFVINTTIVDTTPPLPPWDVNIFVYDDSVCICWYPVPEATSYKVYSSANPYSGFTEDMTGSYEGTTWTAPISTEKRFYYVTAIKD